ncbi:MAG TPA: ABC transporter ATP-binding protein [Mycobacteriales bacterium]|nr:ABC transporter ATP-binding protein [Mycobacteriales bacterium]
MSDDVLLELDDVRVHFGLRGSFLQRMAGRDVGSVKAVDGVSLTLRRGEVLGVVGESGSGKTTLGRAALRTVPVTSGSVRFDGIDLTNLRESGMRPLRRRMQLVFQDPNASLNPAMTIGEAVGDPLRIHGIAKDKAARRALVAETLERVGLTPAERYIDSYPANLSGGQKQRVVIARAVICGPDLLVADEPVSMLDMSVRARILDLMLDLKRDLGLTYLYVTHDLATAKFFCDTIAIMYLGRVVEYGPAAEIYANPRHPYTQALLRAIPEPDPARSVARDLPRGEVPDAAAPPLGCSFHPRCPVAFEQCGWESRDLADLLERHWVRPGSDYETERAVVGSIEALERPSTTARLAAGGGRSGADVGHLLDAIRHENPAEPLWKGVQDTEQEPGAVTVHFRDDWVDPALYDVGTTRVACLKYREEPREATS